MFIHLGLLSKLCEHLIPEKLPLLKSLPSQTFLDLQSTAMPSQSQPLPPFHDFHGKKAVQDHVEWYKAAKSGYRDIVIISNLRGSREPVEIYLKITAGDKMFARPSATSFVPSDQKFIRRAREYIMREIHDELHVLCFTIIIVRYLADLPTKSEWFRVALTYEVVIGWVEEWERHHPIVAEGSTVDESGDDEDSISVAQSDLIEGDPESFPLTISDVSSTAPLRDVSYASSCVPPSSTSGELSHQGSHTATGSTISATAVEAELVSLQDQIGKQLVTTRSSHARGRDITAIMLCTDNHYRLPQRRGYEQIAAHWET